MVALTLDFLGWAPEMALVCRVRQTVLPTLNSLRLPSCEVTLRSLSSQTTPEAKIEDKLRQGLQGVKALTVQDTSGGCGSAYSIAVTAEAFR